jgi:hypothetical protein
MGLVRTYFRPTARGAKLSGLGENESAAYKLAE